MRNSNYIDVLKGLHITPYSSETHSPTHYEECSHLLYLLWSVKKSEKRVRSPQIIVHLLSGIKKIYIERL